MFEPKPVRNLDEHFLGQLSSDSAWMPDGRRVLMFGWGMPPFGYDLATQRRLGTLFPKFDGNTWLCIGPTGHYRGGSLDQSNHGADPTELSLIENQVVYACQTDTGEHLTLSPAEFRKRFGWTNEPSKARLMGWGE